MWLIKRQFRAYATHAGNTKSIEQEHQDQVKAQNYKATVMPDSFLISSVLYGICRRFLSYKVVYTFYISYITLAATSQSLTAYEYD